MKGPPRELRRACPHNLLVFYAWPFYRTISGVLLCWELEEPTGPKGEGPAFTTCWCSTRGACLNCKARGARSMAPMPGEWLQRVPSPERLLQMECYRKISGVRLCWELEEPRGPKGQASQPHAMSGRHHLATTHYKKERMVYVDSTTQPSGYHKSSRKERRWQTWKPPLTGVLC